MIRTSKRSSEAYKQVVVEVVAGKNLITEGRCDVDPYVVISLGKKKYKTKVIRANPNPIWCIGSQKERFVFEKVTSSKTIVLKCMDYERFSVHDRLGMISIPVSELSQDRPIDEWMELKPEKPSDEVTGTLHVRISINSSTSSSRTERSSLWNAVSSSDLSLVQAELRKDSIDKYEKNPKTEETLLHLATKSGDVEIVRLLLENQFSVYSRDKDGNTPLHLFCRFANSPSDNLLKLFQQQNSREDIFNIKNNFGETPLHYVVFNPYLRVVLAETLLAAGANPNIQAENHDTPLHYAVQLGREDLVKVMICFGADETIVGARDCTASVLAKQLGFENVASSIKDTIELKSYLKRINMEKYLSTFVMEDLYLCHFPDLSESILSKLIKDESDRQVLLDAAKDVKAVCSTESVARKKEYVKKKENQKLKESQVRQVLESKLKTDFQWEIEIEDLEFIQLLGNGASGEVYKGLNGKTVCAIKVLKTLNENWTKEVQDFTAEFNIAYKIKSPHIVTFFGATLKQKLCMVMEYCGKGSLFHLLKDEYQIFDWTTSLRMLEEIVLGVLALHRHKPIILHRDLKTLNVLVTEDLSCKLCDFGLSRFDTTTSLDTLQKCRGTFAYIAPEVFRREGYDIKSDVYSISIIMWEVLNRLLTGRYSRPFAYLASEFAILIEACEKGERPEFPDKTPTLFSSLVERCWEPVKDKRLDSEQLLIEIDNIQEEYKTNQSKWDILIKNPDKCRSSKKSKHQSQKRH